MSSYSNTTLSQVIKIPKSVAPIEDLEIEWLIGPIEIYDEEGGKEFIHKGPVHLIRPASKTPFKAPFSAKDPF